jgi:hypothetical protein
MHYPTVICPPPPKPEPYNLDKLGDDRLNRLRTLRPDLAKEIDATFAFRAQMEC